MKLFFADTETTGLDPRKHEMFQFAFIIEIDGKIVEEVNITMRPTNPEAVTQEALDITKKTIEEIMAYQDPKEAYKQVVAILAKYIDKFDKTDKFVWIGQNPTFDTGFVRVFFKRAGDNYFGSWFRSVPTDLISFVTIMSLKGYLDLPNFKLGTICEALKIKLNAHDALDDVRATREAFHILLDKVPECTS